MTDTVMGSAPADTPFAPYHRWDRNFFLALVLGVWTGIILGFGGDIQHHIASGEMAYPWIVHVHAAAFVGWLALLTTQILLIRTRRPALHYRLGAAMMGLALFMVIIGPATAITMQRLQWGTPDSDPAFLSIQLTDIIGFAVLVTSAFLLRGTPSAHKRLMLLSTIYISDAGFARFVFPHVGGMPTSFWPFFAAAYAGPDFLVLSLGAYDLVTRRRLHPAYVAGALWVFALQTTAAYLYLVAPFWKGIAIHLIGH